MSEKDNGGQAFPRVDPDNPNFEFLGMTMRDYFAAKAMQGILANSAMVDAITDGAVFYATEGAYAIADAMLKARQS